MDAALLPKRMASGSDLPCDRATQSAPQKAAALGKKAGAYVVLNPAPAPKKPLPEALLKNVDLLIPNETEASYIAGIEVKGEDDIPAAMDEIQKLGVKDVIITVGSKGVCARLDGELIRVGKQRLGLAHISSGQTGIGARVEHNVVFT